MKRFAKMMVGAGAAALVTFAAASPAQAQYYPYPQNNGVDVGQIVRGVAVAGAVSAAVGAITNAVRGGAYGNGGYGYPNSTTYPSGGYGYPTTTYPNGGYSYPTTTYPNGGYAYPGGYSVQANSYANFERAAVSACGAQAQRYGRVSVDNVERRSNSTLRVRGMIEANAGVYGGGLERRTFVCSFRNDGRVTDFDTDKVRY